MHLVVGMFNGSYVDPTEEVWSCVTKLALNVHLHSTNEFGHCGLTLQSGEGGGYNNMI